MMKLKYQTQERDTRMVFESLSSLVKQCTADVKDGIESLQEMIKSQSNASESHSADTVNEVTKFIACQQAGLLEELSHKLELQEKKIDSLACELKQQDEKTTALLKEADLSNERRREICSLSEAIKRCEEQMKQQRELIIKEVKETVMSTVSKLGTWNKNWPHKEGAHIRINEIGKEPGGSEEEGCRLVSAGGSPLLNMALSAPVWDVSASEQTVPSCDWSSDSDSVGIESLFSEPRTPDISKSVSPQRNGNRGPHSYKHTKIVFLKSHSHREHHNRSKSKPLQTRSVSCFDGELIRDGENMERQCLSTARECNKTLSTTSASDGHFKRKTRQKRALVVEPTCYETARHISKVGALLSHRAKSDSL
jgi:hypothetical protein